MSGDPISDAELSRGSLFQVGPRRVRSTKWAQSVTLCHPAEPSETERTGRASCSSQL